MTGKINQQGHVLPLTMIAMAVLSIGVALITQTKLIGWRMQEDYSHYLENVSPRSTQETITSFVENQSTDICSDSSCIFSRGKSDWMPILSISQLLPITITHECSHEEPLTSNLPLSLMHSHTCNLPLVTEDDIHLRGNFANNLILITPGNRQIVILDGFFRGNIDIASPLDSYLLVAGNVEIYELRAQNDKIITIVSASGSIRIHSITGNPQLVLSAYRGIELPQGYPFSNVSEQSIVSNERFLLATFQDND